METESVERYKKRGIYLLPNLLTTVGLFAGFYAIVLGIRGHFSSAAVAIFIAMLADALDGRVARLLHAQTAFGTQYDSLADMVSFGITPALVMYSWSLSYLGKFGWLTAFLYAACVALRLARFNVQTETSDKRYFKGLASTSSAGVMAGFIWMLNGTIHISIAFSILSALVTIMLASLMVSNIRYRSFKELDFKGRISFFTLLIVVLVIVAISVNPPAVLFTLFLFYALSGPIITLTQLQKIKSIRKKNVSKVKKKS